MQLDHAPPFFVPATITVKDWDNTVTDIIRYLVKPDDMIGTNVGLKKVSEGSMPKRPLLPPVDNKKLSDNAHSKGVLMWDQDGKTILHLSTSATIIPSCWRRYSYPIW